MKKKQTFDSNKGNLHWWEVGLDKKNAKSPHGVGFRGGRLQVTTKVCGEATKTGLLIARSPEAAWENENMVFGKGGVTKVGTKRGMPAAKRLGGSPSSLNSNLGFKGKTKCQGAEEKRTWIQENRGGQGIDEE